MLAKTSSAVLTFFITVATLIAAVVIAHAINSLYSSFAEKITSNYQSFKNENDEIFSEIYKDPTISLKDKILFFHIYLMYCIQLPFLYYVPKISYVLDAIRDNPFVSVFIDIALVVVNTMLLIPVAILELIKYPLIKLFSPLGLNVKQLSFLFNVSDVGTGSQSVHTRSFEDSVMRCAKELKETYGTPSNVLDEEFRKHIDDLTELTNEQKQEIFGRYIDTESSWKIRDADRNTDNDWRNWSVPRTIDMTVAQAVNLVLTVGRKKGLDLDLLKVTLTMRFRESKDEGGFCGQGVFDRIIYALSGLEAENNFTAQLEPQLIGELAHDVTRRFFQKYVGKHCQRIKVLKENFDDLYSPGSEVNLSNLSNEVKNDICSIRQDIKEFVFRELYIKFYNDYGQHIQRGTIKQKLRELITDEIVDSTIYAVIDDVQIPPEPSTYFEKVKAMFGGCAKFSTGCTSP